MLILNRKPNQAVTIAGGLIRVKVLAVNGNQVKLGFTAPDGVRIMRDELTTETKQNKEAVA